MLDIDDLIDFTNKWFYIAILSVILFGYFQLKVCSHLSVIRHDRTFQIICFLLLFTFYLIDLVIYIVAIKKCPHTFINNFFSVYIPLFSLFSIIITCIIEAFKTIAKYGWTLESVLEYSPWSFLLVGIKISFALVYGSLCAILWILFDFVMALGKMMIFTDEVRYSDKKYY